MTKVQWRVLPTQANRDMEQAGADAAREYLERTGHNNLWVIYEAMTAAAPKPPACTEGIEPPVEFDERAAFEAAYAEEFSKVRGCTFSAHDVASMRDAAGGYGDRAYLNGQWSGWQARAALEKTQ